MTKNYDESSTPRPSPTVRHGSHESLSRADSMSSGGSGSPGRTNDVRHTSKVSTGAIYSTLPDELEPNKPVKNRLFSRFRYVSDPSLPRVFFRHSYMRSTEIMAVFWVSALSSLVGIFLLMYSVKLGRDMQYDNLWSSLAKLEAVNITFSVCAIVGLSWCLFWYETRVRQVGQRLTMRQKVRRGVTGGDNALYLRVLRRSVCRPFQRHKTYFFCLLAPLVTRCRA